MRSVVIPNKRRATQSNAFFGFNGGEDEMSTDPNRRGLKNEHHEKTRNYRVMYFYSRLYQPDDSIFLETMERVR